MKQQLPGNSGLSLVETLMALFIIASLAMAGSVLLSQSLRAAGRVQETGEEARRIRTMLAVIRDDLAAFVDRPFAPLDGEGPMQSFEGYPVRFDGLILHMVRNSWPDPGDASTHGDLQRLEYRFEKGALLRRSWSAPDPAPSTQVVTETLLSGLERIEARYGREETWQPSWTVRAGSAPDALPQKVELIFVFSGTDQLTAQFRLGAVQ